MTQRDGRVIITDLGTLTRCSAPLLDSHERATAEYGTRRIAWLYNTRWAVRRRIACWLQVVVKGDGTIS